MGGPCGTLQLPTLERQVPSLHPDGVMAFCEKRGVSAT